MITTDENVQIGVEELSVVAIVDSQVLEMKLSHCVGPKAMHILMSFICMKISK